MEVARFVQVEGRNMETLTYIQKEINANSEPKPKRISKLKYTRDQKLHSNFLKTWRWDLTRTTMSQGQGHGLQP